MTRALAAVALAALAAVALSSARPAQACACGVAIEASVSEEQALVIEQGGRESIVLSLDLTSDGAERAAVVLPVPSEPDVEAVRGGDPLAYTLPAGAGPILAEYVEEGWRFVAIRLAPESNGPLKPLAVRFETDEYVYPMKLEQLATEPLDLTLFTLADGERQVDGLDTVWVGTVDERSPQPPEGIGQIFAPGTASVPAATVETDDDDGISTGGVVALIIAGVAFAIGIMLIMRPRSGWSS